MRAGVVKPGPVVDIKKIAEFNDRPSKKTPTAA